ncbi:hypothetical protein [Bacillus massilinigeriensis]|nr:hypothetical protein [Bacillus massilionigeriensis]
MSIQKQREALFKREIIMIQFNERQQALYSSKQSQESKKKDKK